MIIERIQLPQLPDRRPSADGSATSTSPVAAVKDATQEQKRNQQNAKRDLSADDSSDESSVGTEESEKKDELVNTVPHLLDIRA